MNGLTHQHSTISSWLPPLKTSTSQNILSSTIGSPMSTRQGKWSLMVLGTMGLLIQLAEAAPRDADPPPDPDFLEFLGSWHAGDG